MQWSCRKNWSPTPHLTRPKGLLVPIFWCQISQDTLTGPLSMSWKVRAVLMAWEGPMQYPGDLNVAVTYTRSENCRQCQAFGHSRSLISGSVCSVWSIQKPWIAPSAPSSVCEWFPNSQIGLHYISPPLWKCMEWWMWNKHFEKTDLGNVWMQVHLPYV